MFWPRGLHHDTNLVQLFYGFRSVPFPPPPRDVRHHKQQQMDRGGEGFGELYPVRCTAQRQLVRSTEIQETTSRSEADAPRHQDAKRRRKGITLRRR